MKKIELTRKDWDKIRNICNYVANTVTSKNIDIAYNEAFKRTINDCENGIISESTKNNILDTLAHEHVNLKIKYRHTKTDADKTLLKVAKVPNQKKSVIEKAISDWFYETVGVECTNEFVRYLFNAAGRKVSYKTLVNSEGKKITVYNHTNLLRMCYMCTFEQLVEQGLIHGTDVPYYIRVKYGKIRKDK